MAEQSWFRVDRKASKWHKAQAILDGAAGAHVFLAECGAGLGDSPDREPRTLITEQKPARERTCAKCMRIEERDG